MAKKEKKQTAPLQEWDKFAIIKTTNGTIKVKLFKKQAPHTVNNFMALAQDKYYDGIIFHRVIKDFMIQWWDPTGTGMWGESIYGEKFNDEFDSNLSNIKYSLSMANAGPNTNGSQFFINQNDNVFLDNKHTVFGQVIEGMDNVDKIIKSQTDNQDKPIKDIKIISIVIQKFKKDEWKKYKVDKKEAIKDYKKSLKKSLKKDKKKKLELWDTVAVHYTLTVDGQKKDSSLDRGQPFEFTLWEKQVIKWWEDWLIWYSLWDNINLEVQAQDGYWEYDETKLQIVPKEQLADFEKNGIELKVWNKLPTQFWQLIIKETTTTEITLDMNHELAGKELFFEIEVVDVK